MVYFKGVVTGMQRKQDRAHFKAKVILSPQSYEV